MKLHRLILFLLILSLSTSLMAQRAISGIVIDDETEEPLIGANIIVGTTGTVTDIDGTFMLTLPADVKEITVSYTGYSPRTITDLPESGELTIRLTVGSLLDEVVVVGYSQQKRADITGAISVVDIDDVAKSNYSSVVQSLQGKVSGVNITQDGEPGGGRTNLRIRGITSVNSNDPLYIIDGVPSSINNLNNLSNTDIESIQILKDAAASIYGSRAAAGVVVITTKKGSGDRVNLEVGTLSGLQTLGRRIELLDATQWGEVYWTARQNAGLTPRHPAYGEGAVPVLNTNPFVISNGRQIYQYTPAGTDWYDEIYQDAYQQQYYLNASGGGEKGNFFLGANYFEQEGLIKFTDYDRINTRLNTEFKAKEWLSIGENLSVSISNATSVATQQGQDGIPTDVLRQHPALPVYDLEGNFAGKIEGFPDVRNMVSVLEKDQDDNTRNLRLFGNAYVNLDLLKLLQRSGNHSLNLRTSYGLDYSQFLRRDFQARFTEGDFDIQNNLLVNDFNRSNTITWTNTLDYGYQTGKHSAKFLAGYETVAFENEFLVAVNTDFLIEDPAFTFQNAAAGSPQTFGGGTEFALRSLFARAEYVFADRYLLTATMRRDETSRFKDVGYFPAVSVGWRISNEDFFQNSALSKSVDEVKLKASWGQLGNQTAGDFTQLSLFGSNINTADYDIGGTNTGVEQGFVVQSRGNPNVTWETTTNINIGLFTSFWNGKLTLEADYWIKETEDILFRPPLLATQGEGDPPVVNIGTMENAGVDLQLGYNTRIGKELRLGVDVNFTAYENTFTGFNFPVNVGNEGESYLDVGNGISRIVEGLPYGVYYGFQVDGIFQNQGEVDAHADQLGKGVGRLRYSDLNGDGMIDDQDRTYLGSFNPDFTYGLSLNLGYKRVSLSAALYGSQGNEVYNRNKIYTDFAQSELFNHSTRILDAWSPENTGSDIPSPIIDDGGNNEIGRVSSYFVEDGSYLKLRALKLGYEIPEKWLGGNRLTVYVEGQNLAILTNYTGVDPELPYEGRPNLTGTGNAGKASIT
ncbi:MAG: SusC/RagA family TonB-linked outer membrane protein, partial [Bacteroidota bacterium]